MYSALVRNGGAVMMDDIDNTTSAPGSTWGMGRYLSKMRESRIIKETEESLAQGIFYI
jgi:hypothetical protein